MKIMIKKIRDINSNARIFWTNVGTASSDAKVGMDEINGIIDDNKTTLNYTIIDWRKEVKADPSLVGSPSDGVHPNVPNGYNKLMALIVTSIGKAGDVSAGSDTGGGTTEPPSNGTGNIPYDLPATSGKTGLESEIDENSRLLNAKGGRYSKSTSTYNTPGDARIPI